MADATAAYLSVGVWEQLHCFFIAWGFLSSLRPGSGLAPTFKGLSPSPFSPLPPDLSQQRRNSGVAPTRQRRSRRMTHVVRPDRQRPHYPFVSKPKHVFDWNPIRAQHAATLFNLFAPLPLCVPTSLFVFVLCLNMSWGTPAAHCHPEGGFILQTDLQYSQREKKKGLPRVVFMIVA